MQQIADQVGVHVTTVSRAVDDKWVQTPRGIFPLKRFFGGGTQTASGEEVAWETIKQKLLEIIDNEDKSNPLSDEDLVTKLQRGRLSRRPAHGDEVPQDAEHPVVAAAEGLDGVTRVASGECRVASEDRSRSGFLSPLATRHSPLVTVREDRRWPSWRRAGWSSSTAAGRSWTASTSRSTSARSSACSGPTAPARPPASA